MIFLGTYLREINFGDSRSAKFAIMTILYFLKTQIYQITKILSPLKLHKMAFLELLDSPKLISRKIRMTEKS